MKYVIKNLRSFIRTEKMIFVLIIVCIFTSSFIINFSFGLYYNFQKTKEAELEELYEIEILFENSAANYASKEKLRDMVLSFSDKVNDKTDMYFVRSAYSDKRLPNGEDITVFMRFCVENNKITPCSLYSENMQKYGTLRSGKYFTAEQEAVGEKVALVFDDLDDDNSITRSLMKDDSTIIFQGEEFKIIGTQAIHPLIVPFESLKDDTAIESLFFHFTEPVTRPMYTEIKDAVAKTFPDIAVVPDLELPDPDDTSVYNTMIVIAVFVVILASINFAVLYRYILSTRVKKLAIFRICGCTKLKAAIMLLTECMIIAIPSFLFAVLIYVEYALPLFGKHFEYITEAYSTKMYIQIFLLYMVVSLAVLSVMLRIEAFGRSIRSAKEA